MIRLLFIFAFLVNHGIFAQTVKQYKYYDKDNVLIQIEDINLIPARLDTSFFQENISFSEFNYKGEVTAVIIQSINLSKRNKEYLIKLRIVPRLPDSYSKAQKAVINNKFLNSSFYMMKLKKVSKNQFELKEIRYLGSEA